MRRLIIWVLLVTILTLLLVACTNIKIGEKRVDLIYPKNEERDVILVPTFSWNFIAPFVFGTVQYDLYLYESKETNLYLQKKNLKKGFFTPENSLKPNTTYYWKVVAHVDNTTVESATWSFKTVNDTPPTPPELLKPQNNSTTVVNVTFEWKESDDPDGDLVLYSLYVSTNLIFDASDIIVEDIESNSTKLILSPNTIYYWKVVAYDEKKAFVESEVFSFKTEDAPPTKPVAIYPKDGQEDVATPVKLYWFSEDPEGKTLTYDVYFGESGDTLSLSTSDISEDRYEIPQELKGQTEYYWKIIVKDPSGNKAESNVFMFKTQ